MMKRRLKVNKIFSSFLFWLFLTTLIKGIIWSFLVPIWHFPDEQAHFAQISYFVETGKMPPQPDPNDLSQEILISERLLGTERDWAGNNKFTYHPEYNIEYTDTIIGKYEKEITSLPNETRQIMEKHEAASYPPLYYIITSIAYKFTDSSNLFTRIVVVRLLNLSFFLMLVGISYKLFRLLFSNDRLIAMSAVTLVAFHPMLTFVSSGVNSDNLFNLLFTIGIYVSFTLLHKKLTLPDIIVLSLLLFLSMETKPQWRLLLYVYLFPLIWQVLRGRLARRYVVGGGLFAFWLGGKVAVALYQGKQVIPDVDLSNLQMPQLSFLSHIRWSIVHTIREVVPWYWGVFKWLGVVLPRLVNRIINRVMVISAFGLVVYLVRSIKQRNSSRLLEFIFLIYIAVGYFLSLTIFDFLFTRNHGFSIGIQGRYFFPTIVVHMGLLLWGIISLIPKRFVYLVAKLTGIGMVVLNVIAFYTVSSSYYDVGNLSRFFLQVSQYKPWFAKSPYLEFWFILYGIILVIFLYQYVRLSEEGNVKKT